jgi:hypothetical protein
VSRAIQTVGRILPCQSWADCTINMCGFSLRQGQVRKPRRLDQINPATDD